MLPLKKRYKIYILLKYFFSRMAYNNDSFGPAFLNAHDLSCLKFHYLAFIILLVSKNAIIVEVHTESFKFFNEYGLK